MSINNSSINYSGWTGDESKSDVTCYVCKRTFESESQVMIDGKPMTLPLEAKRVAVRTEAKEPTSIYILCSECLVLLEGLASGKVEIKNL